MVNASAEDFTSKKDITDITSSHYEYMMSLDHSMERKYQNVWVKILYDNIPFDFSSDRNCFAYKLKNGKTVIRIYPTDIFDEYTSDEIEFPSVVKSEKYMKKYAAASSVSRDDIANFSVRTDYSNKSVLLINGKGSSAAKDEAIKILEAFRKDLEADKSTWETVLNKDHSISTFLSDRFSSYEGIDDGDTYINAVCIINLRAKSAIAKSDNGAFDKILMGLSNYTGKEENLVIPKSYVNTINVLKELEILNDDLTINQSSKYFSGERVYKDVIE